jgi:WS/DGAT/MGAT family acyltransferase
VTTARAPRTPFNGPNSQHRRVSFGSLSLDAVKAIKNELGITVNDVVVTICAGAVRRWLLEHDALPRTPLVAMIPVSVRSEQQRGTYGNQIAAMIVPIPTHVADPRARLQRAHELLRSAKELHAALPASLLTDATRFIPSAVGALAARTTLELLGRTRPPLNLIVSNVPGPREPLYVAGALVESLFPVSVVVDGVGLNMPVMSYRDHVDLGIVGDRAQIEDAWPLMAAARESFEELEAAVLPSPRYSRRRRAPAPAASTAAVRT